MAQESSALRTLNGMMLKSRIETEGKVNGNRVGRWNSLYRGGTMAGRHRIHASVFLFFFFFFFAALSSPAMDTSPASSSARLFFFLLLSFVLAGSVLEAIWRRRPPSSLDSKARAEASCGGASVRQEAIQALASECDVALERKMVARRGALTSALILEYLSRSGPPCTLR